VARGPVAAPRAQPCPARSGTAPPLGVRPHPLHLRTGRPGCFTVCRGALPRVVNVGASLATLPVEESEILVEAESGVDLSDGVLGLPSHTGARLHCWSAFRRRGCRTPRDWRAPRPCAPRPTP
jgi:hypothetical protein